MVTGSDAEVNRLNQVRWCEPSEISKNTLVVLGSVMVDSVRASGFV